MCYINLSANVRVTQPVAHGGAFRLKQGMVKPSRRKGEAKRGGNWARGFCADPPKAKRRHLPAFCLEWRPPQMPSDLSPEPCGSIWPRSGHIRHIRQWDAHNSGAMVGGHWRNWFKKMLALTHIAGDIDTMGRPD